MSGPAKALGAILSALDRLEIPYMVGGSVASTVHGISRPTMDVDIIAEVTAGNLPDLLGLLESDFYGDLESALDAVRRGRAFNVIHFSTTYKFDIFPLRADPFDQAEFSRRAYRVSSLFGEPVEICVATAEDTILAKLRWYRMGGETSERQWEDVRGVVQVSRDTLDWDYLSEWGRRLGLEDLLARLKT